MGLFLVVKGADILISSAVAIGKKYGVTDNCVKKWIKRYNL